MLFTNSNHTMTTKPFLIALAALSGAPASFAQSVSAGASTSVACTATTSLVSQYMFRGQRLNGAGFQPAVEATAGNFTGGVWANVPFEDKVPGSANPEIDLYGSYTTKLNDAVSFVPGFTSYHFPRAPQSAGFYRWTFEPNLAASYTNTTLGVKFMPKVCYDTVLKGATFELSAYYALPLKDIGSELDFMAIAGTYKLKDFANDTSPSVKAWGDYWLLGVSLPFQINAASKVTLGFAYTEGRNAFTKQAALPRSPNSLAMGRGVVTLSYGWSF
jgi:uncharacterized protein (TIGR02001 family)